MPSSESNFFCSGVGVVTRRRRISRPSVVGRMISALTSVLSKSKALAGEKAEPLRSYNCFSVTHSA